MLHNPLWIAVWTVHLILFLHIHPMIYLLSKFYSNCPYFRTPIFVELQRYCCLYQNPSWCDWSQTMQCFHHRWLIFNYQHKILNPPDLSWYLLFAYHRCSCSWIIGLLFWQNSSYLDFFLTLFGFCFPFADCCGMFPKFVENSPPSFRSSWIALRFPGAINKQSVMSLDFYPQILVLFI